MKEIVVWAELGADGYLEDISLELMGKAAVLAGQCGGSVGAVLMGFRCEAAAEALVRYGAERVHVVDHNLLALYQSDLFPGIMADILREAPAEIVLIGGTSNGMDLAPRMAAKLNTGLTAHCVDLRIEQIDGREQLIQVVPGWGGQVMLEIICPEHRPQMATVRPGIMEKPRPDPSRKGEIIALSPEIRESQCRAKTLKMIKDDGQQGSIEDAEVIVSGGFGLFSAGGFGLVRDLAKALGGEVAGTRPAVDHGWIPEDRMIGQSGKTVRPKLLVSVGASGALHYTTGFSKSEVVVAIDRNPEAPVFQVADFGVAGDLNRIVPCLIEELKNLRPGG
jgi:caffeyl-CoA reductase-Etf complex subunit CarE